MLLDAVIIPGCCKFSIGVNVSGNGWSFALLAAFAYVCTRALYTDVLCGIRAICIVPDFSCSTLVQVNVISFHSVLNHVYIKQP